MFTNFKSFWIVTGKKAGEEGNSCIRKSIMGLAVFCLMPGLRGNSQVLLYSEGQATGDGWAPSFLCGRHLCRAVVFQVGFSVASAPHENLPG